MRKRLLEVGAYSTASAVTRAVIVALSPVLAALAGEAAMARWSVAVSLSSLYAAVLGMGISAAILRWHADASPEARTGLIGWFLRLRLATLAGGITVIAVATALAWGPLTGDTLALLPYMPLLILYGLGEATARFLTSVLRLREQPWLLMLLRCLHAGGAAVATLVLMALGGTEPFAAFAVAYALGAVPMLLLIARIGTRPETGTAPQARPVLRFALPLTLHDLSWWLRGTALTLVLANSADDATVGAFFLAMLVIMPFGVLLTGIDQAVEADYYRARASGTSVAGPRIIYRASVLSTTGLAILCMLTAGPLARALLPDQAAVFATVAPIALFGITCHAAYVVWVKSLIYQKRSVLLLSGTASISLGGVVLAAVMTPIYGYGAAAWSSAGMFAATALFVLVAVRALGDKPLDMLGPVLAVTASGVTLAVLLY